ncbi:MAG: monooxygenase, partial [Planctomycetota bacterium]
MLPRLPLVTVAALSALALASSLDAGPREVTYHQHVAKILKKNCQSCHRPGDIGPMALLDYESSRDWAGSILEEIQAGRMPPWSPDRGLGEFRDERRLTSSEADLLERWVDAGAPEGRARRLRSLAPSDGGWTLGTPDLQLAPDELIEVTGSDDIYRCYPLATSFEEERWIRAVEVLPGDRRVVHHVILFIDPGADAFDLDEAEEGPGYTCFGGTGTSVTGAAGGWAPGFRPMELSRDVGIRLPAGATIVMQVHYHPEDAPDSADREHGNGDGHDDSITAVGLWFHDETPDEELLVLPVGTTEFTIPAGAPDHEVTASFPVPFVDGIRVHTVAPHMHLLGRTMRLDAELPDGTERTLVSISDWNFDWQANYMLSRPAALPRGTLLRLSATYDNSSDNPHNPVSPPVPVTYGEETVDEMCFCFLGVTLGGAPAAPPP